jgi:APA family basic amino acid/polyamine antiporter
MLVAVCTVVILTGVVLAGIRLSNRVNIAIVSVTLLSLIAFIAVGSSHVSTNRLIMHFQPASLLHSAALMFVAFTGYGRIATLGEEVLAPQRTIPRAIIATLVVSTLLYIGVATVAVGAVGADQLQAATTEKAAPLEVVARNFPIKIHWLVAIGAMTAMLGVLLNLVLGLSRVVLAMGRRKDMPRVAANLSVAVVTVGTLIAALTATSNIKTTWTFSAFAVLIYYAVTNLAALRLNENERLYGKTWALIGLLACLVLAFAIEPKVWATGLCVLGIGLAWHWFRTAMGYRESV